MEQLQGMTLNEFLDQTSDECKFDQNSLRKITNFPLNILFNDEFSHFNLEISFQKAHLTEQEAKPMIAQLIEGIDHLHSHGVVHRDLNPNNVFLHLSKTD